MDNDEASLLERETIEQTAWMILKENWHKLKLG